MNRPSARFHNSRMALWVRKNRNNIDVINWTIENPPPADWQGTDLEYAYAERPSFNGKSALMMGAIGLIALAIA